ncbi:MAG: response regulator [Syntrophorhabdales bacterium]|jgi:DNA-binding NtrC family response regulator
MQGVKEMGVQYEGKGEDAVVESNESLVLLVDDDKLILDLLSSWLEATGFRPIVASNGLEAIDKFRSNAFSMVISDLSLGSDPDGFGVLEAIRRVDRNVPVIMMSGEANTNLREDAIRRGAYAFLSKPFDLTNLLDLARTAVSSARLHGS